LERKLVHFDNSLQSQRRFEVAKVALRADLVDRE
jgi:hypothetical protein